MYLVNPNYRDLLLVNDTRDEPNEDDEDNEKAIEAHNYVFVNANGAPFKSSGFSTYLGRLLSRLTGCKATSNILRSSFVTNLFESNPSDAAKSSAQALLRHGDRMQAQTYDRRIPAHKKLEAQRFATGSSGNKRDREARDEREDRRDEPVIRRTKATIEFSRGMLVVVPFFDSQTGAPSFWFAKILNINDVEAQLIELKLIPGQSNTYRADLTSTWTESIGALRIIDAEYEPDANQYVLRTSTEEVLAMLEK